MRLIVLSTAAAALLLGACPQQETRNSTRTAGAPDTPSKSLKAPGRTTTAPTPTPTPGPPAGRQQVARYRLKKQNLTDEQLVKWIAEQPEAKGLISLDLRENKLTHVGVEALAKAEIGTATALFLSKNPIGDKGAKAIVAGERFFSITILYLASTKITAVGVRALLDDKTGLKWIWELDLNNNPLGDPGVEALAKSSCTKTMTSISLSNVGMTDKGARALAASPHLGKLKNLYVDGNKLTSAGIKALKESKSLAKCEVYVGEEK